jgi:hypothetical protein
MRWLLGISLAIALSAFLGPWLGTIHRDYLIYISFLLTMVWGLILTAGILKFRVRGFWLLIGLPLVAYWPVQFFWLWGLACAHSVSACP